MKREKLFYAVAFTLLAVVLVLTLWYKRSLDIRELTGVAEPETISVSVERRDAATGMETRELTLSTGDEDFDDLLARLEEIQFRRPPTNLLRIALPFLPESSRDKEAEDGEFQHLTISLSASEEDGTQRTGTVLFDVDQWLYQDTSRDLTLDLAVTDSKETGQTLCAELWEKAQIVESES